ncbi:molecular chaperone DnaJ [Thermomonospora cellulosilytica]|uniref:Putative nucleic acid-binding Zn-ribbon protein n=1 Tax=Thermomonospora cellulosilytica TaxID=1411118 RepID=A0A7W3RAW5_9ACTN|nr:molecular chaperone DnaJ [Thermomonospora cellulosilytica]MBA9006853.1 putative nucleic acid-binding Zn-ribbon protein [Thermomonospora cellulosilytica]
MRGAGDQRRRGRRGGSAEAAWNAAVAAREQAATAFYDMDQAQKYVGGRVTLFADLDPAAAASARREMAALNERANATAAAYIAVLDAHDLDDLDRSAAEYEAARRALESAAGGLAGVTAELNGFAARLADRMAGLEAALERLPPRLAAARDAVAAAEAAVERARAAGLDATDPETELAQARRTLDRLSAAGLGGLGLSGALEAAEEVRRVADAARERAEELPREAEKVRNSLTAVRTRVEVVAGRLDPVRAAMRDLLRGYALACWQDLKNAPEAVEEGLARARERIAEAEAHAGRGEWRQARRAVTAARTELTAADRRARQVTDRLADLNATAADPGAPAEAARFVVRDAQRLVVGASREISPRHARTLDTLAERLEAAPDRLTGPHPDYWSYLQELESIKTAARDVVDQVRSELARHHGG